MDLMRVIACGCRLQAVKMDKGAWRMHASSVCKAIWIVLGIGSGASAEAVPPTPLIGTELRRDCDLCPIMVPLEGGTFTMGSPRGEGSAAERPEVEVALARFEMSRGEITIAEYAAFIEDSGYRPANGCFVWTAAGKMSRSGSASWQNPGYEIGESAPVACVSWEDANRYVSWLNARTGGGYRLPSEAEFEFAARAGSSGAYAWGDPAEVCSAANGAAAESQFRWRNRACEDGVRTVARSGSFPPNGFGLVDTIGNLWEWTADCWNGSHNGASSDGSARSTGQCRSRVLRGGSWDDPLENLRSAYRVGIPANRRQGNVGFRVAR